MFDCGAKCPIELWRQITPHGVFVYTKGKETVFTNCPPTLCSSASCSRRLSSNHSTWNKNQNKTKQKNKNPLDGKIEMLHIACSAAREFCFLFHLRKRVSFHAEVLMQLALLFPNVCQLVLQFQRVKETRSSFSFKEHGLNLATLLTRNLLPFLLFFPRLKT